jgi:hypothetical protein
VVGFDGGWTVRDLGTVELYVVRCGSSRLNFLMQLESCGKNIITLIKNQIIKLIMSSIISDYNPHYYNTNT